MKDCSIKDVSKELQIDNSLRLVNRYGSCILCFKNDKKVSKWINAIDSIVYELKSHTNVAIKDTMPPEYKLLSSKFIISNFKLGFSNDKG